MGGCLAAGHSPRWRERREPTFPEHPESRPGTMLGSFAQMIWFKNSRKQTLLHNLAFEELKVRKVIRFADRYPVTKRQRWNLNLSDFNIHLLPDILLLAFLPPLELQGKGGHCRLYSSSFHTLGVEGVALQAWAHYPGPVMRQAGHSWPP